MYDIINLIMNKFRNIIMLGILHKMHTYLEPANAIVQYKLVIDTTHIDLNPLIGKQITLNYTGKIFCIHCHKSIKKTYNQGYCYPCFSKLAECDLCMLKPHTCHFEQGTCRDPSWANAFCFQPHIVYLANSSAVKVGITRSTQLPTRWIDQGATQGLPVFKTPSRYLAGVLEITFGNYISDKTHWQKMLKGKPAELDLTSIRDELLAQCNEQLTEIYQNALPSIEILIDAKPVNIEFPLYNYPDKIKSLCLLKTPHISGILIGIKGQYLILDSGVINIRKYTGYEINFAS